VSKEPRDYHLAQKTTSTGKDLKFEGTKDHFNR